MAEHGDSDRNSHTVYAKLRLLTAKQRPARGRRRGLCVAGRSAHEQQLSRLRGLSDRGRFDHRRAWTGTRRRRPGPGFVPWGRQGYSIGVVLEGENRPGARIGLNKELSHLLTSRDFCLINQLAPCILFFADHSFAGRAMGMVASRSAVNGCCPSPARLNPVPTSKSTICTLLVDSSARFNEFLADGLQYVNKNRYLHGFNFWNRAGY